MSKRKEHNNIAIAGRVNAGKSSLLNLLSGQKDFAIVDAQPGTTADTVITRMEIHDLGPMKIFDTAGVDEYSELGDKKRKKTYEAVDESDLVLVVLDILKHKEHGDFSIEMDLIKRVKEQKRQVILVYNIFDEIDNGEMAEIEAWANQEINHNLPSISLNILNTNEQRRLVDFIKNNFKKETREIDLLPLKNDSGFVLLVIPMDEETPTLRLLRPQDMAIERILRKFMVPVLYRMDLKKARANDADEKARYTNMLEHLKSSPEGLNLVITDSQAMDIIHNWTPIDTALTTFSVMMANFMSGGNLELLINGLEAFATLKNGDKILIIESCNHDRKCDDIGTKQIPRLIKEKLNLDLNIDFCFGRPLEEENLSAYKLALHCGGCMIDKQKYTQRINKLAEAGVPVSNYGLFLSWINDAEAVERVSQLFKNNKQAL